MKHLDDARVRVLTRLGDLIEEARLPAYELIALLADQGVALRVGEVFRPGSRQHALYLQGRASLDAVNSAREAVCLAPITNAENGRQVTHADRGSSYHEYRRALDVFPVGAPTEADLSDPDNPVWENPWWNAIGYIGKSLGFEWGGDWSSGKTDRPHFQWTRAGTLAELRTRYPAGMA